MNPSEPLAVGSSMAIKRASGSDSHEREPEANAFPMATNRAPESQRLCEPYRTFPRGPQANGSFVETSPREGAVTMQPSPGRTARLSELRFAREP